MPTYEYECQECGHRFEEFQRMSDEPIQKCPKCGGKVKRLIGTGAGMIFKGSGFYVTDYRSSSYKDQKKKESGDSSPAKDQPKPKDEGSPSKKKPESGGSADS
jgi:putative FmdB family regulatory protein